MATEPPHDLDAERCVIGAMVLSYQAIDAIGDSLTAGDFYRPAHATIFDAILRMRNEGRNIDVVTLNDALAGTDAIAAIGGPAELLRMVNETPAISSVRHYAEILMAHSLRRRLIGEARELIAHASDLNLNAAEVLDDHQAVVSGLGLATIDHEPDDISVQEFLARDREKMAPWVVRNLIRRNHKLMLVGGEGSGKSWLLRFVALCGAYGVQPFRQTIEPPIRSLIVDAENPEDALFDSFEAILRQVRKKNEPQDTVARLWWRPQGMNLRNRADLAQFENVIRVRRPELICIGPLYALYENSSKDFGWETAAREVQVVLKRLMVRYNFALMIEDHAPQDRTNGMRPYGSSFWRRWPDIGIGMEAVDEDRTRFKLTKWRGDRVPVDWPSHIERGARRGSPWPFVGDWDKGEI